MVCSLSLLSLSAPPSLSIYFAFSFFPSCYSFFLGLHATFADSSLLDISYATQRVYTLGTERRRSKIGCMVLRVPDRGGRFSLLPPPQGTSTARSSNLTCRPSTTNALHHAFHLPLPISRLERVAFRSVRFSAKSDPPHFQAPRIVYHLLGGK